MHRFRSWTLDPPDWRTQRNRALSLEGGDGSALNVDFTTGVLDPTVSHSRGSDATFINSSGLVQYADANLVLNSTMLVSTAWSPTLSGGGTATINGDNTVTFSSTAGRAVWLQGLSLSSGLPVTFSIEVTALTNTNIRTSDLFAAGFGFGSQVYNYTDTAGNTQTNIGSLTTLPGVGLYTITAVTTGTTNNIIFGTDCNGVGRTGTVTIARPQVQYGHVVPRRTYVPNSSTTAAKWDSPRFDYDPTTLEANGLLIEGNNTNLVQYSDGLSQNPWFNVSNVTRTLNVGGIAPNGTNNAASRIGMSGPIGASSSVYYNGVTVTNQQYTHSVFAKADGADWIYLWVETSGSVANGAYFNLTGNGSVGNLVGSGTTARIEKFPNGWYRCQTTSTQPAGTTYPCLLPSTGNLTGRPSMVGTTPGNILVWGDQFEANNGASSYIPTGASSVTRTSDVVTLSNRSWFTSWTSTWFADYKVFSCAGAPVHFYMRSTTNEFENFLNIAANSNNSTTDVISRTRSGNVQQWTTNRPQLTQTNEFNKTAWVVDTVGKVAHAGVIDYTSGSNMALPLGTGLNAFDINNNPTAGISCSMWVKSIKYYPRALNNAELVNLTKPTIPNTALALNFTSGTLSSLLTFNRTSYATFINSSGQVQFADSNLLTNSVWTDVNSTPSGWSFFSASGGSVSISNITSRTVTATAAGQQPFLHQSMLMATGITYTMSVVVTDVTGFIRISDVLASINASSTEGYYINGVFQTNSSAQATTGTYALVFTGGSVSHQHRFGCGSLSTTTGACSVTFHSPRLQPGRFINPSYIASPVGSAYQAPRFDYDPTTLVLKGLLIEGQATNLLSDSENFAAGNWLVDNSGATNPVVTANHAVAPDGNTTADRVQFNKTGGAFSRLRNVFATTGTSGATYTFSVWMRTTSGTGTANVGLRIGAETTGENKVVTGTWQRFQRTIAVPSTDIVAQIILWDNIIGNDETADVLLWGAQLETGSGASSYIPTGAGQVTRNQDECQLLDLTTMGFNANAGTILTDTSIRIQTGSNRNYSFLPTSGANNQMFEGSGIAFNVFSAGSFVAQIGSTNPLLAQKVAAAYALNDYAVSVSGETPLIDTSGALPTSLTKLTIGGSIVNAAGYMFGCMRNFNYWSSRLNNNQIKYLSGS